MLKTRKKWISILLTLAMLVGLMVPLAAPASAADNYTALTAPNVNDDSVATLGTIFAKFTAGQLKQGDSVIFRLPDNFEFRQALTSKDKMTEAQWNTESVSGNVYYYGIKDANNIQIPETYSSDPNGLYGAKLDISVLDDNEIQVTITDASNANLSSDDAVFYLNLGAVYVESGFDGDINVAIDAPANSGFSSASVPVGRVTGGTVSIAVTNVDTFSNDHFVTLRIKEDTAGALSDENDSIKLKLPSGFEWGTLGDASKTDSSPIKTLW
ncbi:trypsin-like serine proteases, typically periplasmic, contain C-terminal PDZ domain [Moorella thermoacetica Y72]|uniref:Trypsin-like serine proteases, typically periplasmic, contain C-terminal PDZ domain n=1 Tax=Moorella thermoacetica Y72 TaxID=1325331 RepID=A0A0S6U8X3_NEOTH|nr:hypothetical protein [Moorella thermoacetica]GAF25575.1 trypsin-like serine proteases, typically periplasmic, contain C-terminal PDZ domain [Moorella thermoacetica Y72]